MESGLGISDISVVIPSKMERGFELAEIIAYLKSLGFEDIIIAEGDMQMYNRYLACRRAKNDVIYTQDDDCIIGNIEKLISLYEPDKIIANIKLGHMINYEKISGGKIALVGWGAIFHRDLIKNFNKFLNKYGEDKLFYREADRVFTWLNKKELLIADASIKDFPTAWGGLSIEEDHAPSMMRMVDRLKTL